MLEAPMFAAELFGAWGPGPIGEPVSGWARFSESIANDPGAVATIVAAFFGFLGGVLVKYGLDRRADRLHRATERRILATALRSELVHLDAQCKARIESFEELLQDEPDRTRFGGPHSFASMTLPPRRIWTSHLGRIGELEGFDPDELVMVFCSFDSYDVTVEALKQRSPGQGVGRKDLEHRIVSLNDMRAAIANIGGSLVMQAEARRPWWRRMWRF